MRTTACLPLPDLPSLLAEARDLTRRYMAGQNPDSFHAFRNLVQLLLGNTVVPEHAAIRLTKGPRPDAYVLGGYKGPTDPVQLNDGRFLRISMTLFWTPTPEGNRVKVASSSFQYQMDGAGDRWIFRYDYNREAPDQHPSTHLHIRGSLQENCLGGDQLLERIHFPTSRISLEAVIRLLIEQFNVPSNTPPDIWRKLLAESEALFLQIAHKSLSGPTS